MKNGSFGVWICYTGLLFYLGGGRGTNFRQTKNKNKSKLKTARTVLFAVPEEGALVGLD
jgi:hypothetical protein